MYNFDPDNVLLAIATNIPQRLNTAFVLQGLILHLNSHFKFRSQWCKTADLRQRWTFEKQYKEPTLCNFLQEEHIWTVDQSPQKQILAYTPVRQSTTLENKHHSSLTVRKSKNASFLQVFKSMCKSVARL